MERQARKPELVERAGSVLDAEAGRVLILRRVHRVVV
jgi:hypothetical protein